MTVSVMALFFVTSGTSYADSPNVTITAPSNNAELIYGNVINITATVTDANGIYKVLLEVYSDTTGLLVDSAPRYPGETEYEFEYDWETIETISTWEGSYTIKLTARDYGGYETTKSITIFLNPVVSITSPIDGDVFITGVDNDIHIKANASDLPPGEIIYVEFYADGSLLPGGVDYEAPYEYTWANVPADEYTLTVMAHDNDGHARSSAPVEIAVCTQGAIRPVATSWELYVAQQNSADYGDTIVLAPGTYEGVFTGTCGTSNYKWHDAIEPDGKSITYISSDQENPAVIYGFQLRCSNGCDDLCDPGDRGEWNVFLRPGAKFTPGPGRNWNSKVQNLIFKCGFISDVLGYMIEESGYCQAAVYAEGSNPKIINCKFEGGTYTDPGNPPEILKEFDYEGIYCENSEAVIEDCDISIGRFGLLDMISAIDVRGNSNIKVIDCDISNNSAHESTSFDIHGIKAQTSTADERANLTIENSTISGNEGYSIRADDCGDVTITGCIIDGEIDGENISHGMYLHNEWGRVKITDSIIKNCTGGTGGAGVYIATVEDSYIKPSAEIENCIFTNNINNGASGGAINISRAHSAVIKNCQIFDNKANHGGGICVVDTINKITIEDCNISNNEASTSGGGVYGGEAEHCVIKHCVIKGNKALYEPSHTGCKGGGIYYTSMKSVDIINCLITKNEAEGQGGGLYLSAQSPSWKVYNCTIINNKATGPSGLAGGGYFHGSHNGDVYGSIYLTNNIFWGNEDTGNCNQISGSWTSGPERVRIKNCDIQDSKISGTLVVDVISESTMGKNSGDNIIPPEDPEFIDLFHLGEDSPCRNAGDDDVVNWSYDLDREPRVMGEHVDIGADEIIFCDVFYPYYNPDSDGGWWKFDEWVGTIAYDSADGHHGTLTGDPEWTEGKIEGALDFDGDDDWVDLGDDIFLESTFGSGGTISVWVKPTSTLSNRDHVVGIEGRFAITESATSANYWEANIYDGEDTERVKSLNPIEIGKWVHLVATWDTSTLRFYVNGEYQGYVAQGMPAINEVNRPVTVGAFYADGNLYYTIPATIDDVRIYDRALSVDEVKWVYWYGQGFKAIDPNPADGATGVDPDTDLSWSSFDDFECVTSYDVYLGTDYESVENADTSSAEYKATVGVNSYDPGGLEPFTTYYWRVDVKYPGAVKGDVWKFTTWLDPDLVSLWMLDDGEGTTAIDSAGGHHGTLFNGPVWTTGQIDGALSFDGVDDYVSCGYSFPYVAGSNTKTITAWVKSGKRDYPSGSGRVLNLYRGPGCTCFSMMALGGDPGDNEDDATWQFIYIQGISSVVVLDSGVAVGEGVWTHVALVQDGSTVTCYVNGSLANYATNGGNPLVQNPSDADMGCYDGGNGGWFEGVIDDVRIYQSALDQGEIVDVMNNE